jgi:MFS transporter, DHA1 family, inner membrane transport protein
MLTFVGPGAAFAIVGTAMMMAAIPIALGPDLRVVAQAEVPLHTRQVAWRTMFADGLRTAGAHFTWLIALFITLGEDFTAYGGALALAGVAGAAMGLVAGRSIDLGHGLRALQLGVGALAVAIAFRAIGSGAVWSAVLANAAAAVAWPAYATAQSSKLYDLAKQSPCALRYHVVAEGGWDAGVALGCTFAAVLVHFGFGFHWPIALGLVGCWLVYQALSPEYAAEPQAR